MPDNEKAERRSIHPWWAAVQESGELLGVNNGGRRRFDSDNPQQIDKIYETFRFLMQETKEVFLTLHLDGKNRIIALDMVSIGSLNQSIVHPREVFKSACLSNAAAVILIHQHPTGDPRRPYTMAEIIYVLTNEAMPGFVKIGLTKAESVESRIATLSQSTSIPLPFECHFAAEVKDCAKLEKTLHQLFSEHRVNPKREFFKVDPEKVVLAISIGEFKEVTPGVVGIDQADQETLKKAKERRPRLRLEALGIKPGDVLTCSRDESLKATVTIRAFQGYQHCHYRSNLDFPCYTEDQL